MLCFLFFLAAITSFAQTGVTEPPYKKHPTLPPITLLLGDSATKFTKENLPKKKPVFFLLFSPECSHCQHTTEEIIKHKEDLKDIEIVMATLNPLWQMNEFVTKYNLKALPNVVVGKDFAYVLPAFYNIKNLPFMAFYNKKGDLISIYEGLLDISRVLTIFKEN